METLWFPCNTSQKVNLEAWVAIRTASQVASSVPHTDWNITPPLFQTSTPEGFDCLWNHHWRAVHIGPGSSNQTEAGELVKPPLQLEKLPRCCLSDIIGLWTDSRSPTCIKGVKNGHMLCWHNSTIEYGSEQPLTPIYIFPLYQYLANPLGMLWSKLPPLRQTDIVAFMINTCHRFQEIIDRTHNSASFHLMFIIGYWHLRFRKGRFQLCEGIICLSKMPIFFKKIHIFL